MLKRIPPQATILMVTIMLLALSELFPPWQYEYAYIKDSPHLCPAGYSYISRPPAIRPYDEMVTLCRASEVKYDAISVHTDWERLKWQRSALMLLAVGLIMIFSQRWKLIIRAVGTLATMIGCLYAAFVLLNIWLA